MPESASTSHLPRFVATSGLGVGGTVGARVSVGRGVGEGPSVADGPRVGVIVGVRDGEGVTVGERTATRVELGLIAVAVALLMLGEEIALVDVGVIAFAPAFAITCAPGSAVCIAM